MAHLESNFLRSLQKMYPKEGRKREAFSPASLFHRDENDKKEGEEKFALPDFSAF